MTMTRVLLFGRVSTVEGQDPEHQLQALRAVASRKGWEVVGELPLKLSAWDEGEAKKVWKAVVDKVHETSADVLAVWAMDRLHRGDVVDAFRKLDHLEGHLGVQLYSLQEPFLSTATSDPAMRELLLPIVAWVAKWESQRRSERLRVAAATKRNRAAAGGGRAYWGRGRMPTEADVQNIRALRSQGLTLRVISERVGLSKSTVHRIIQEQRPAAAAAPSGPP